MSMRRDSFSLSFKFACATLVPVALGLAIVAELACVPLAQLASAEPRAVAAQDDDEERDLRMAQGKQSFQDNCLMCHGLEMTAGQRLTAKQWGAEVDKMIGWGAPVPAEQKVALTDYLISTYPADASPVPLRRLTLAAASAASRPENRPAAATNGDAKRGQALYMANCATCHGANARGGDLGTNLVENQILHRPNEFNKILREGRHRMPGFQKALNPAQEGDILAWLLELHYP